MSKLYPVNPASPLFNYNDFIKLYGKYLSSTESTNLKNIQISAFRYYKNNSDNKFELLLAYSMTDLYSIYSETQIILEQFKKALWDRNLTLVKNRSYMNSDTVDTISMDTLIQLKLITLGTSSTLIWLGANIEVLKSHGLIIDYKI